MNIVVKQLLKRREKRTLYRYRR